MPSELDIKFPEIHYDGTKADMYKHLKYDPDSPFYGQNFADIFLFAMALAKKKGIHPKSLEKPNKLPASAFDARMRAFMRSIMIDEHQDVYAIKDNTALRRMCEDYANAGINDLYINIKEKPVDENGDDILAKLIQS